MGLVGGLRFFSDRISYPSAQEPWFELRQGDLEVSCDNYIPQQIFSGPDELVAGGSIEYAEDLSIAQRWEMRRRLYSKGLLHPDYGENSPVFSAFMSNYSTASEGRFARMNISIENAVHLPAALQQRIESANEQVKHLQDQMPDVQIPDMVSFPDSTYIEQLANIMGQITEIRRTQKMAMDSFMNVRNNKLLALRDTNNVLPATTPHEIAWKYLHNIMIKQLLREPLSTTDITELKTIALQPKMTIGSAAIMANSLLPECEKITPPVEERMYIARITTIPANVAVMPNPASTYFLMRFPRSFTGILHLCDLTGRIIQTHPLERVADHVLNTQGLAGGIYYLSGLNRLTGERIREKVVIIAD